jgi:uncharacterized protein (DUF2141 family)
MRTWLNRLTPFCLLLSLVAPVSSVAETADTGAGTVQVELSGLQNASGNIYIAVYDSDDTWLGDEAVLQQKVVIADALDGEIVRAEFQLQPGEYAFSIFYDINNNGKLDTNFIGIPKEPVALSNNARPKFGPPKYKDAVFPLGAEPVIQRISIEAI